MPFLETVKLEAKKRANFCCVICKSPFVEVHHIIPQAEGGPDTLDNAAPLCCGCHDLFGANPDKRKQIREMRDLWWEVCEKRNSNPDTIILNQKLDFIQSQIQKHHQSLEDSVNEIKTAFLAFHSTTGSSIAASTTLGQLSTVVGFNLPSETCPKCGKSAVPSRQGVHPGLGMVQWYRCNQCSIEFPGEEELVG